MLILQLLSRSWTYWYSGRVDGSHTIAFGWHENDVDSIPESQNYTANGPNQDDHRISPRNGRQSTISLCIDRSADLPREKLVQVWQSSFRPLSRLAL